MPQVIKDQAHVDRRAPASVMAALFIPILKWPHYADHALAPLCRSSCGLIMRILEWLHICDHWHRLLNWFGGAEPRGNAGDETGAGRPELPASQAVPSARAGDGWSIRPPRFEREEKTAAKTRMRRRPEVRAGRAKVAAQAFDLPADQGPRSASSHAGKREAVRRVSP